MGRLCHRVDRETRYEDAYFKVANEQLSGLARCKAIGAPRSSREIMRAEIIEQGHRVAVLECEPQGEDLQSQFVSQGNHHHGMRSRQALVNGLPLYGD